MAQYDPERDGGEGGMAPVRRVFVREFILFLVVGLVGTLVTFMLPREYQGWSLAFWVAVFIFGGIALTLWDYRPRRRT